MLSGSQYNKRFVNNNINKDKRFSYFFYRNSMMLKIYVAFKNTWKSDPFPG
jgi:hypothetical protein